MALKSLLKQYYDKKPRFDYPHEGGERPYRYWLASGFIEKVMGWPNDKVISGEVFDIRLLDEYERLVVYIETKPPGHILTKEDIGDFEERIKDYGTLNAAYITNGTYWGRADVLAPRGDVKIVDRISLDLDQDPCTPEEVEHFFSPIWYDPHLSAPAPRGRNLVAKDKPHVLLDLASVLDDIVGRLASFYQSFFEHFRTGRIGNPLRDTVLSIFELWCKKALVLPPPECLECLMPEITKGPKSPQEMERHILDLGFPSAVSAPVADALAALTQTQQRVKEKNIREIIWPLYSDTVEKLCAQTAHVMLARALLYRIGEDYGTFGRTLSSPELEDVLTAQALVPAGEHLPAFDLMERVRQHMKTFLPTVYEYGEFDWWWVDNTKRPAGTKQARLLDLERQHNTHLALMLRQLDGFFFGEVDVDVWRNVYQNYLPTEDRQKLGGFFTPDELIDLVLDLLGYVPDSMELCQKTFIDPACGSGAFVANAISRLLTHLECELPCHSHLHRKRQPSWKKAEAIISIVTRNLHAVDIHPFAAFLTTLNVVFLLLPYYLRVRSKNPHYALNIHVYAVDSLLEPEGEVELKLFEKANSRIRLSQESIKRYKEILKKHFDFYFGNPPWGGKLKGRLSPVYDKEQRRRLELEYPAAALGKYDIYGLFIERALKVLNTGGRLGLVTQGSFVDKSWARGVRKLLAEKTCIDYLVDLNPFGQTFFKAMNIPCIVISENTPSDDANAIALLSSPPKDFRELSEQERKHLVVTTVRKALEHVERGDPLAEVGFARACNMSRASLRKTARERWNLSPPKEAIEVSSEMFNITDLLEPRQGVTPGVFLDIFLLTEADVLNLKLEEELIHKAIKTKEAARWSFEWKGRYLLYPYLFIGGETKPKPAFSIKYRGMNIDALNFYFSLDKREKQILRGASLDYKTVQALLNHRLGLGLVKYPNAANYLLRHYERLGERVFEQREIREHNKEWYEYWRPRDEALFLKSPRIVSPTLSKKVRFALDSEGYLSDHACYYLLPTKKTIGNRTQFLEALSKTLKRDTDVFDVLKYCLAFLNSPFAQYRFTTGYRPRPGEVYSVTKPFFREIPIPPPKNKKHVESILKRVNTILVESDTKKLQAEEKKLFKLVMKMLGVK
ncbi:N-6 DNA methylase [Nitrospinae bacterium AH_259_B05_G02_I21]|nr:N-6 DNA methylase [Nitrospinae bacterium AH_259_B05_G02_I21]MDA2932145.1 N-6 DNA methylase [Nitrospinae bacterium AH-259-F20]